MIGFECLKCSQEYGADYKGYVCAECGGNLNILYDYGKIKKEFTLESIKNSPRSDVWKYRALFPFSSIDWVPPLDFSLTPLYRNNGLEKETGLNEVYLKDDTRLPSGSFKDRASSVVMAVARERGVSAVSCASTGNAGSSWACMGAACGIKVVVYVPASAPRAKIAQLKVYGADIKKNEGTYDEAFDLCVRESRDKNLFNRSTGYNPFTREGKKSVSFEIFEQLGFRAPGSVFVPVGDGNIISGVWKGFKDLKCLGLIETMPRLMAVQSTRSDAIARTVDKIRSGGSEIPPRIEVQSVTSGSVADSISVDKPRDGLAAVKAILLSGGEAVRVSDEEIIKQIPHLASRTGIFAEPAGVASVAGLRKMREKNMINKIKTPAVCLLTGNGLKDVEAVL